MDRGEDNEEECRKPCRVLHSLPDDTEAYWSRNSYYTNGFIRTFVLVTDSAPLSRQFEDTAGTMEAGRIVDRELHIGGLLSVSTAFCKGYLEHQDVPCWKFF